MKYQCIYGGRRRGKVIRAYIWLYLWLKSLKRKISVQNFIIKNVKTTKRVDLGGLFLNDFMIL